MYFYDGSCCIIAMHKMKWSSKCWWTNDRTRHHHRLAKCIVEWKKTVRKSESKRTEPKKIMEKSANLKVNFIFAGRLYSSFALVFNFRFIFFLNSQSGFWSSSFRCISARARPSRVYASKKFVFDSNNSHRTSNNCSGLFFFHICHLPVHNR